MAERAHPHDPAYRNSIYETRLRQRYQTCQDMIQDKIVLDAPCGTAWGCSLLSGYRFLAGLDISQEAIQFARQNYPGIEFSQGDMRNLPYRSGSFDVLLCLEGLEHIYRQDANYFLAEAKRILRSEGRFVVTVPLLKNGKHSTNPYHLYEYQPDEIRSLLNAFFETDQWVEFEGPDGPEIHFTGYPRAIHLELPTPERQPTFSLVAGWLDRLQTSEGYKYHLDGEANLLSTCFAILIHEGLGSIRTIDRNHVAEKILNYQDQTTGVFLDRKIEKQVSQTAIHDRQYIRWQMTYFALQALDALGTTPRYPLNFVDEFIGQNSIEGWLAGLQWQDPWLESNRIMFFNSFLVFQVEKGEKPEVNKFYHQILDWLDQHQDIRTGLWGTTQGANLLNAVAAAYHFIPFYEYVHRPIIAIEKKIDTILGLQQADGLFGAGPGGGACEDEDAISLLATLYQKTTYRCKEIKQSLIRSFWAIWNLQNQDGGFPYANRSTVEYYKFSSLASMQVEMNHSDTWATWFRLVALATISQLFPHDLPRLGAWTFRRWPALGYQRFDNSLSEIDTKTLPNWMRLPANDEKPATVNPQVSVIVPCHNLGNYLPETLDSIFRQTYRNFQIIIVDDGSSDPFTLYYLERLDHPKIRVIHTDNMGVAAARNTGIREAESPYICCLDADDLYHPNFLSKTVPIMEKNTKVGFVTTWIQEFDGGHELTQAQEHPFASYLVDNRSMVAALFRRQAWEEIGGYGEELPGLQDWDFWIGILENGYQSAVIPEPLFYYRVRSGSMFSKSKKPENFIRIYQKIFQRHNSSYHEHIEPVLLEYKRLELSLIHSYKQVIRRNKYLEEQYQTINNHANARHQVIQNLEQELVDWRYMGLIEFLNRYFRRRWNRLKSLLRQ